MPSLGPVRGSRLHHLHVAAIENQAQQGFFGVLKGEGVAPGSLRNSVALFSCFATLADEHSLVWALDVHKRLRDSRVQERRHGGTSLQERDLVSHLEMMQEP